MLEGQSAVVTGGASGIGRVTARRMAAEGAAVAVIDLDGEAATAVADELAAAHPGRPHSAHQADVTDPDGLAAAVDAAAEVMGGLTLAFNNAGVGNLSPIEQWDPAEWQRIVGVNLGGVFAGIRAEIPHLRKAGGGCIVNTASISGNRPAAGEAPYAAAKAGVAALTATAALEYGPEIRVNAVSPGMIVTALTEPLLAFFPDEADRYRRTTPLGRLGEPEDIADVVVFLCSEQARFITGQNLVVDGGMTLHGSGVDGLFEQLFRPDRAGEGR